MEASGVRERQQEYLRRIRSQRGEMRFASLAGELRVPSGVAHPKIDSHLLALAALPWTKGRVLDAFCGSGVVGLTLAQRASSCTFLDISEGAISACKANSRELKLHEKCNFYVGTINTTNPGENFDLITANPPYTDAYAGDLIDLICIDPKHEALFHLIRIGRDLLRSDGYLLMSWASFAGFGLIQQLLASNGFQYSICASVSEPERHESSNRKGKLIEGKNIEYRVYRCWRVD
jgi:methylase of polypeptide subunit release factors